MSVLTSEMTESCTADQGRLIPRLIFTPEGKLTPASEGVTRVVSILFKMLATKFVSTVDR